MVASVPAAAEPSPSVVLVGTEAVSDIDATAIETVSRVEGVELARAFPSVRVAVEAFEQRTHLTIRVARMTRVAMTRALTTPTSGWWSS